MSGGKFGIRIRPDFSEFRALAALYSIIPVWGEVVADTVTPVSAFRNVVGDSPGFLLESVEGGERWGRYSFVGRNPLASITARGREVETNGRLDVPTGEGRGILATLEEMLETFRSPTLDDLPPLHGGVVGYLGYDVVREIERLPDVPPDDLGYPDAKLHVIGQLAAFDHWGQRLVLVDNVVTDPHWSSSVARDRYDAAARRVSEFAEDCLRSTPMKPVPVPRPHTGPTAGDISEGLLGGRFDDLSISRTVGKDDFCRAVDVAKEHIVAGDAFQIVLSQRYDLVPAVEPFEIYRALRLLNPSPYLYFLRFPEVTVVGSSPEPMVRVREGEVVSRPIAGSRPRGENDAADQRIAGELSEDPKERAEHIMLVDLARNDVGRVVNFKSEKVDELMTVERYSHIMHLTSQVSGKLRSDLGSIDVLRATLPAGTLSGAPKVRAMEIIDALEPTKRGLYGGVVGYLDFSGNLDTAIAIRTLVMDNDGNASIQAGAGIVADSDPEKEDEECAQKAAALFAAIAAARDMAAVVVEGPSSEIGSVNASNLESAPQMQS